MTPNIEVLLYLISSLLIVIILLICFIIYHLRKKSNNYDWSLVYPELAGMYDHEVPSYERASSSIDNMLDDNQDRHFGIKQSKTNKSIDGLKLDYINGILQDTITGQDLMTSVYAPESVDKNEDFLIAVFSHLPSEKEDVASSAKMIDDEITKRAEKFLRMKVNNGDEITLNLNINRCDIDDPIQTFVWNGRMESIEFVVSILDSFSKNNLLVRLDILINTIPAGNIKFRIKISNQEKLNYSIPSDLTVGKYNRAFISYASHDRNEVLRRTQMLSAAGITYFQDLMNLKPGEIWEKSLYKEIDNCDVFFLFWSTTAKNSEWVKREYLYAKSLNEKFNKPEIIPIPIEGPPTAEPPKDLSHLHFNDGFLYFLNK